MIFLHLLEMLKDGTSIDVQSVSNLSGSDIPIAGDKLQNGISRFWTTFLDRETTNFFLPSPGSDFFSSKMNKERYL